MGFNIASAKHIENLEVALEKAFEIHCYGLSTGGIGGILVDDQFWLEGYEGSYIFCLIPKNVDEPFPYSIASFYADCIAYEHEVPTQAFPRESTISNQDIPWIFKKREFVGSDTERSIKDMYLEYLQNAGELANQISNGAWMRIGFRHDWIEGEVEQTSIDGHFVAEVRWRKKYEKVSTALHLYNAALRQTDPLSAYLNYYHVIENIVTNNGATRNNGKNWIQEAIQDHMNDHLPPIWTRGEPEEIIPDEIKEMAKEEAFVSAKDEIWMRYKYKINIVELIRVNALSQLQKLTHSGKSYEDIARRLYNENRCGIAHGGTIKSHALDDDFVSILNDILLIKYLARLSIEYKLAT